MTEVETEHDGAATSAARAARRYLDLLKGALLDEHYLENELRIQHLVEVRAKNRPPEVVKLRDPLRYMRQEATTLRAARRAGHQRGPDDGPAAYFPYTTMGRVRLDHLHRCLEIVRTEAVPGDFIDCGVGRGGAAIFMRGFVDAYELDDRCVWIADRFRAAADDANDAQPVFEDDDFALYPDINIVRDGFHHFGLLDERTRFLQGRFSDTFADAPFNELSVVRIGEGHAEAVSDALAQLYDSLSIGGYVIVDQYARDGVHEAVDAFRARRGVDELIERIDDSGAFWRKTKQPVAPRRRWPRPKRSLERAPLPPPRPGKPLDLSVVVVFYNMRREAARTLHSLTRAYQREIDATSYEVIVVENGSTPEERLGEDFVRSFGPEFRYIDLAGAASPSPVFALNRGIEVACGDVLALMIDGAHVLTPRVLRYGLAGLSTYAPAIVATQQWYIGPGDQGDAMLTGYDQEYEDGLFDAIEWPVDGYRLFDIGSFIGDRDWFDGMWESNCIFVSRRQLQQVGGFDESFSVAGGGYANLDLYERLGSSADVSVVTIIGEGSFHQLHGGTTTNQDPNERRHRVSSYGEHFREIRGRRFRGPGKPIHYVGSLAPGGAMHRTKGRRRIGAHWYKPRRPGDPEGVPTRPIPIPDELKTAYIDAVWHSLAWQETTWLGRSLAKPPTDLFAYQEILARLMPEWIIEIGTGTGGRAFFLATICQLLGNGTVVSVDAKHPEELPRHDRITYVTGDSLHDATFERVLALIGERNSGFVILGSLANRQRLDQEFERYAPLVPVGSYVVIEDTIVNGHPVWPTYGAGPAEAVKTVINTRNDFAPDPELERYGLTFNPRGFLRRIC